MRYLFVVQGEGRGHLTQALSLKTLLERDGHEVVSVMVGCSAKRRLPDFFTEKTSKILTKFQSPNFMPMPKDKRPFLLASILYNIMLLPVYIESILTIRRTIRQEQPDIVVNFYELLCGLTYGVFKPSAPMINIAHQYYFQTSNFRYTGSRKIQFRLLNLYSSFTSLAATKILALSFRNEETEQYSNITIVPPLLRAEVLAKSVSKGNYIHGYMLNAGYVDELASWCAENKNERLHFFWDKKTTRTITEISNNLTMHALSDSRFLKYMSGAKAYATTAGFESVCEAMYMQKPVLMVPTHIEQECNVIDALRSGAGVSAGDFDLSKLLEFIPSYTADLAYKMWVNMAPHLILDELTNFELAEDNVLIAF
jgi:uncharacterized protein (TIGR00661 family)